jgi:hypothetical protein
VIDLQRKRDKRLKNSFKRMLERLSDSLISSRKRETLNRGRLTVKLQRQRELKETLN